MLAYIRGTLQLREITGGPADSLVVEVAGVGFELSVPRTAALTVGEIGDEVLMHTALSIRETDWTIFGFATRQEKDLFELLQSVSGVGPKLALAVVGTLTTHQVVEAILSDDHKMLSQSPGVGSKVAQRMILELKSKIEGWQSRQGMAAVTPLAADRSKDEARAILEGLGYTPTEINLALRQALQDEVEEDVEMLVRHSLKVLGGQGR